ncbi:AraC family transcriptional regulator [Alteromonas facilis]|uniref:AraC family transcriptional regulator n=1 Tax=Alteromonas facilis TaxID=2048004 RepID=UPI000C28EE18|nr:AraC family transcriptional regulator [Alteromonas facilis]
MSFDYKARINTKMNETVIGQLLSKMTMESVFYTKSTLRQPWAVSLPAMNQCMMFHLVIEGDAQVDVTSEQVKLNTGDFVLLPLGQGHKLFDGSPTAPTPLSDLPIKIISDRYETLDFGGHGKTSTLICGAVTFNHPLTLRLLGVLPSILHIRHGEGACSHIITTLSELILDEIQSASPGASGVIAKLADILVITAIRTFLETQPEKANAWFGALNDPRITKAIELVHESPSTHWTLEQLAHEVGMSRTSFAVQFKQLVGNSPMDYLTEWRMSLAYSALLNSSDNVLTIALDYGYQSESSFSRAFKKVIGCNPSDVRKEMNL